MTSENLEVIFQRLRESAAEDVRRHADEELKRVREQHRKQQAVLRHRVEEEKTHKQLTADQLREEAERSATAEQMIDEMKKREDQMIDGWIRASHNFEARFNRMLDIMIYGAFGVASLIAFVIASRGTYPYEAGVIGAVTTVIGVGIAVGEKSGMMPRIGKRTVFEKRVDFLRTRANEADREDLLMRVMVDHQKRTISRTDAAAVDVPHLAAHREGAVAAEASHLE